MRTILAAEEDSKVKLYRFVALRSLYDKIIASKMSGKAISRIAAL
jgi:hypothetical protein